MIEPHTGIDKSFAIYSDDIVLSVDYDDVNHVEVDAIAAEIVRVLNAHFTTPPLPASHYDEHGALIEECDCDE